MTRLSALVVAHNEERHLGACLETLKFADELVMVLDRCSDKSLKIASDFGANVIEGAWPIEGARRMTGIEACTGDWILEVDADERIPEALALEIREIIRTAEPGYFQIRFANHIGGHWVKHGWGAYNGAGSGPRLFSKGAKIWGQQRVHPKIELQGPKRWLKEPIIHYVDDSISDVIARFDRYTSSHANDLRASKNTESLSKNVRRFFTRFFKSYVQRKGYKEGGYGLILGLFAGLYPLVSYLKATLETDERE